uniref:Transmembrane protein n=1 Tax=Cannabis sativa TaxID=3483 RepID=A0A803QWK1_CANSA
MAINISILLFNSIFVLIISLAVVHHAESHDQMVITTTVLSSTSDESNLQSPLPQKIGVKSHLGQGCARGHVARAVLAVIVCHLALPVTMMPAPAMPT